MLTFNPLISGCRKLDMLKLAIACLLILTVASCKTVTPTYDTETRLQPDHGWLALAVTSPNPSIKLLLTSMGEVYETVAFPYGHHWEVMQLPAGSYAVSAFYAGAVRFDFSQPAMRDRFRFRIEPGIVNYFGTLRLSGNNPSLYVDGEDLERILETRYPELLEVPVKFTHLSAYD